MEIKARAALFNALAWLEALKTREAADTEGVEVALQCLSCVARSLKENCGRELTKRVAGISCSEAFGVNVQDAAQRRELAVNSASSFEDIFAAGLKALGLELGEVRLPFLGGCRLTAIS